VQIQYRWNTGGTQPGIYKDILSLEREKRGQFKGEGRSTSIFESTDSIETKHPIIRRQARIIRELQKRFDQ
jgi:hypothetical protein